MQSLSRVLFLGSVGLAVIAFLMLLRDALISADRIDAILLTLPFG